MIIFYNEGNTMQSHLANRPFVNLFDFEAKHSRSDIRALLLERVGKGEEFIPLLEDNIINYFKIEKLCDIWNPDVLDIEQSRKVFYKQFFDAAHNQRALIALGKICEHLGVLYQQLEDHKSAIEYHLASL